MPYDDLKLKLMFEEANYSRDGLMDVEQLAKAVSFRFPHRKHNDDWCATFDRACPPQWAVWFLCVLFL